LVGIGLVAIALLSRRLADYFSPAVIEAEVIVEGEATVMEAERVVRRAR
jgi:hypothetical protein